MKITVTAAVFDALVAAKLLVELPRERDWPMWGLEREGDDLIDCTLIEEQSIERNCSHAV